MFNIGDKVMLKKEITPDVLESLTKSDRSRFGELSINIVYEVGQNHTVYQDGLIGLVGVTHIQPEIFFEKVPEPLVEGIGRYVNHYLWDIGSDVEHCLLGYYLVEWQEFKDHVRLIYQDRVRTKLHVDGKTKEECINRLIHKLSEEWLEKNTE
ncbi:MAG: hypothetical protein PHN69_03945 [Candidatus Pacebacteria bacterium]|nr:hypothetical protein [Candidatus Paceibacterota bacterium]